MQYVPHLKQIGNHTPFALSWHNGLLLRSTNWLGDALMTLPAAYQISRNLPEACGFFVLCPKFLAPLWEACPWVNLVVPMKDKHISPDEIQTVRNLMPGVGVVFPNSFGSAMDLFKCKIPQRIGRAGRWRSLLLTHRIPEWPRAKGSDDCHQLSYYIDLASAIGPTQLSDEYPALKINRQLAYDLGIQGDNWLAIAPGAAYGPAKQWPAEYFMEVARWHIAQGGRVVFVGTAKEAAVTSELATKLPQSIDLAGRTDMSQFMAVLACARYAVANDSGAMHLAAAVGTRGVGIFGSTDPTATGPIGARWQLVISNAECRPCLQRTCTRADKPYFCLRELSPETIINELEKLQ